MAKSNISRLRRNYLLLKALKKASPSERKHLLRKCNDDFIKCLCDICYNICAGNCKISSKERRCLARNKKSIRNLTNKHKSINAKRNDLVQKGGFLSSLIVPAISVAASLIGELARKWNGNIFPC